MKVKVSNIIKRIDNIRNWLKNNRLDAIIIPHDDEYLSEYIPPQNERLAWISGFTGSAGIAVITRENAAIFVDGRYIVQVKDQVDSNIYDIFHSKDSPFLNWLNKSLPKGTRLGYDPRFHRINWLKSVDEKLGERLKLTAISENPIDLFWDDRPSGNISSRALLLDQKYTGKSSEDKRKDLGKVILANKCVAAFLTQLDSIMWILNIRGSDVPCNPVLLCHGLLHCDGSFDLFIDKNRIPNGFYDHVGKNVTVLNSSKIKDRLTDFKGQAIQLDVNTSNLWSKNMITDAGAVIIGQTDPCTLPKACKNEVEIQGMKNCHIRDAVAECKFLDWLENEIAHGNLHDEGIVSDKLDTLRAEQKDCKGLSFGTISAAGRNAAMCHYSHTNHEVPSKLVMNSVYLVDSGGQYLDGTTDITRTVAVGKPSDFIKKAFTLVLKGHIALASAHFPEGIAGQHLDTLARQYLWHNGYDFDHGTGHGVGCYLNVHEGPHGIGKGANNVPLQEGMVVSNEPGFYCENEFGIRLENLIYVKIIKKVDDKKLLGFENLTFVPFDTRLMDISILTNPEKDWINKYHQEVLKKVGPFVEGSVLAWLKNAVLPI